MREDKLYNISGSATTITFSVVAACLLSLIAYIFYDPQVSGTEGLLSFLFNRIHTEHIRIIINLGAILISSLLLLWINNIYTIVRAHSSLPLLFFLLLECSNPELTSELRIGNILVPVILLSIALLYSTYQNIRRRIKLLPFPCLLQPVFCFGHR